MIAAQDGALLNAIRAILYLHLALTTLPDDRRQMLDRLRSRDEFAAHKKVRVVGDDVRKIFAVNSILEQHQIQALSADSGRKAIEILENTPEISLVLMDILMPEMDGFETMRAIRDKAILRRLSMIALTAKAMEGDRERLLEAGASDYIARSVPADRLLSLMRIWMHRKDDCSRRRAILGQRRES